MDFERQGSYRTENFVADCGTEAVNFTTAFTLQKFYRGTKFKRSGYLIAEILNMDCASKNFKSARMNSAKIPRERRR
ncbi:MAG: hypothetical protein ACLVCW_06955 [Campylobacter sp.]